MTKSRSLDEAMRAQIEIMSVYPCVITPTRYGGAYEGDQWAAFRCFEVPEDAVADDITCAGWWSDPDCLVAVGRDPNQAFYALIERFKACAHPRTSESKYGRPSEDKKAIVCDFCDEVVGWMPAQA